MTTDPLSKISRANLVLGVTITAVAGLVWGLPGTLGAGVGAALACLNFWAIGRLGRRAVSRVESGVRGGAALAAGLLLKMTALFVMVWVAVRVIKLPALPFAMGMSVFVVSILLVGLGARDSDLSSSSSSSSSSSPGTPGARKVEA